MRVKEKREWKTARRAHHRRKSRATPSSGLDNNLHRSFTVRIRFEFAARPTESVIPRDNETKRRAVATRRIKFSILSANFTINHCEQNLTNNMYRGDKKNIWREEKWRGENGKKIPDWNDFDNYFRATLFAQAFIYPFFLLPYLLSSIFFFLTLRERLPFTSGAKFHFWISLKGFFIVACEAF